MGTWLTLAGEKGDVKMQIRHGVTTPISGCILRDIAVCPFPTIPSNGRRAVAALILVQAAVFFSVDTLLTMLAEEAWFLGK